MHIYIIMRTFIYILEPVLQGITCYLLHQAWANVMRRSIHSSAASELNGPVYRKLHQLIQTGVGNPYELQLIGNTPTVSLQNLIGFWESYFGNIVSNWLENKEFPDSDEYWEKYSE